MDVELGNALSSVATPGVSLESLQRLDRQVARAHERITNGVDAAEEGYCALDLYDRVNLQAIESAVDALPDHDTVVVIGMGGSALGARAIANALAPYRDAIILDTIDPTYLERVLSTIDLERSVCHVVSKSGETVETRATLAVLREAMADDGVDWRDRTIATTAGDGSLGNLVEDAGVTRLDPPTGVPGRYSVLSSMALPSAIALGVDGEALLAGAQRAHASLAPSLFDTPAYAYGAMMAALGGRGVTQNAFVPYAEDLGGLAHWCCQLWAESLGKDHLGQTPIPGRGIADHHAQLQHWREGPSELAVSAIAVDHDQTRAIPDDATIGSIDLAGLHDLERRAVEASLAAASVPTVRLDIGSLDARSLGEYFVSLEAACMLVAELWGINAFNQPAVEWAKQAVSDVLDGSAEVPDLAVAESLTITSERRS